MFGLFGKRGSRPLTLEQKLEILERGGLKLASPFTAQDLIDSLRRERLEEPGFALTLACLGMSEEGPPCRSYCVNVWQVDTECIEGPGSYVRIAERMAELTQGSLVVENVRDYVDEEAGLASFEFEREGKPCTLIARCKTIGSTQKYSATLSGCSPLLTLRKSSSTTTRVDRKPSSRVFRATNLQY